MLRVLNFDNMQDRRAIEVLIDRLRQQVTAGGELAQQVAAIIADVQRHGDDAVVRYMRKWTDPDFQQSRITVTADELATAARSLDPEIRAALQRSIDHVREYQQHIMPADPDEITIDGACLGLRFVPISRVGLHVPGGKAAYPSSVIMLGVPAQVAGVGELSLVCPPPTGGGGDVSPLVLGVCHMLGIERVYRIGGAQAIAALAYGTETVDPVDFIAGPGNAYTQQAKRQMFGVIGIDGLFGPSEVVVLADESANPAYLAADLIAQAEHDPGCCFLVSTSKQVIDDVLAAITKQLPERKRREAIEKALADWSAVIHVSSPEDACAVVDQLAAEHVTLAVRDPHATLRNLRHGGAWFLGDKTPVASGDYYAGPSHCLPTGTTSRFTSGLSVYTFLKRSSVEMYPQGLPDHAVSDIATLAQAEGLDGHAASAAIRRSGSLKDHTS